MSRKTPSFAQLHDYLLRHTETQQPLVTHNMPESASDRSGRLKAFFDNERAMKLRKNGIRVFHEVLSFHAEDAPALTKDALQKLTEYYLQLRAPHAMAIGDAHFDTANPHVHVMISANELHSNKRVRVSKQEFADIKIAVEQLQLELYPALTKSVCQKPKHSYWEKSKDFGMRLAASLAVNGAEFQILGRRLVPDKFASVVRGFLEKRESKIRNLNIRPILDKIREKYPPNRHR